MDWGYVSLFHNCHHLYYMSHFVITSCHTLHYLLHFEINSISFGNICHTLQYFPSYFVILSYFEFLETFSVSHVLVFFKRSKKSMWSVFVTLCNKQCYYKEFQSLLFPKLSGVEGIIIANQCYSQVTVLVILNC